MSHILNFFISIFDEYLAQHFPWERFISALKCLSNMIVFLSTSLFAFNIPGTRSYFPIGEKKLTNEGSNISQSMKGRQKHALERARTLGLAIWRPNLPDLPQIPRLLATRIDITIFCLVPSIAASQARLSSSSSALDFAIDQTTIFLVSDSDEKFQRGK